MSLMDERRAQMFPRLAASQLARIAAHGTRRRVRRGDILFHEGDVNRHFFVILAGVVEIVQRAEGGERLVVKLEPMHFSGEFDMLTGRPVLHDGRVAEDGEVVALDREQFRNFVLADSELSEIVMRAFILRRVALIEAGLRRRRPRRLAPLRRHPAPQGVPARATATPTRRSTSTPIPTCRRCSIASTSASPTCRWSSATASSVLRNPSNDEIAECLGWTDLDRRGARARSGRRRRRTGRARRGGATAASEGLDVLVARGQRARRPGRLELEDRELPRLPDRHLGPGAGRTRAYAQAEKFGAEIAIPRRAVRLDCARRPYAVELRRHGVVRARAVVIATGARYRKLALPNLDALRRRRHLLRRDLHRGAASAAATRSSSSAAATRPGRRRCSSRETARHVHVLVRADGLAESMSRYLVRRIEETPNITLHARTEIVALEGDSHLERVRWRRRGDATTRSAPSATCSR